jgi:hypothetical protein
MQKLLTAEDLARLLQVQPGTVRKMAWLGYLPCIRFGRMLRLAPADLLACAWVRYRAQTVYGHPFDADTWRKLLAALWHLQTLDDPTTTER